MMQLIRSEHGKTKRSFARKSVWAAPLLISFAAIFLMGGAFTQIGAVNWWYLALQPMVIALVAVALVQGDKRSQFFAVRTLPVSQSKVWLAKVLVGALYILAANLVSFLGTSLSGALFGAQYAISRGFIAALLLTLTVLWQIPLGMWMTARFGGMPTFLLLLGLGVFSSGQPVAGGRFWVFPFAIPARLMAPLLLINPNGLPLEAGSPLADTGVLLPGALITLALFVLVTFLTGKWFAKWGE